MSKEYLNKLKEEDYIAWDNLVNDPVLVGPPTGGEGCVVTILMILVVIMGCVIHSVIVN